MTSALPMVRASSHAPVRHQWRAAFRSMASPVALTLGPGCADPDEAYAAVVEVFDMVDAQCTRFDPASDLMLANAAADAWQEVGDYCFAALCEAARAHRATAGRFDPRVLEALVRLGYARSVETGRDGGVRPARVAIRPSGPWTPRFDAARSRVRVGVHPVDLGGIGKGLAVRWAAQRIAETCPSFLLDAGGDCLVRGPSPDGELWQIGVENPLGGERPIAVLALTDAACVTSSIRLRRWDHGGERVHHLLDPSTGRPGGAGLLAVTVADSDPAEAEVWAKAFFLAGAGGIGEVTARHDAAALWVHTDGTVGLSAAMRALVIWQDAA